MIYGLFLATLQCGDRGLEENSHQTPGAVEGCQKLALQDIWLPPTPIKVESNQIKPNQGEKYLRDSDFDPMPQHEVV